MKIKVNGYEIEGSPTEMKDLIDRVTSPTKTKGATYTPGTVVTYDPKSPFSEEVGARLRQLRHMANLMDELPVLYRLRKKDEPAGWALTSISPYPRTYNYHGVRVEFHSHLKDAMVETANGKFYTTSREMFG